MRFCAGSSANTASTSRPSAQASRGAQSIEAAELGAVALQIGKVRLVLVDAGIGETAALSVVVPTVLPRETVGLKPWWDRTMAVDDILIAGANLRDPMSTCSAIDLTPASSSSPSVVLGSTCSEALDRRGIEPRRPGVLGRRQGASLSDDGSAVVSSRYRPCKWCWLAQYLHFGRGQKIAEIAQDLAHCRN